MLRLRRVAQAQRQFAFWSTLLATLVTTKAILVMVVLSGNPLVPDEGIYEAALEALIRGDDIAEAGVKLGYGPIIFTGSWVLLKPAQVIVLLNLTPLESLRLASLLLGSLASLLVLVIIFRTRKRGIQLWSVPGLALLTLFLLPSYQMWGVLALRESSAILCMVLTAWGLSLIVVRPTHLSRLLGISGIFIGVAGVYMARGYLAFILTGAVVLAMALPPYRRRAITAVLVGLSLLAGNYVGGELRDFRSDQAMQMSLGASEARPNPVLGIIDSRVSKVSVTRENMRQGAGSAYPWNYCLSPGGAFYQVSCEAAFLPVGTYRFLLTPNLAETGFDIPSQRLWAGLENIVWLMLIFAAIGTVAARQTLSSRLTVFVVTLLVTTAVAYALVSGNEGTAFRHKGQFLWAWCLVIALGYGWRPWVRSLVQRKQPVS